MKYSFKAKCKIIVANLELIYGSTVCWLYGIGWPLKALREAYKQGNMYIPEDVK